MTTSVQLQPPRGFSLLEMMVTLAIAAILGGLAITAFTSFKAQSNRRSFAGDLASDLALARSRAVARQRTQVVVIDAVAGTNGGFGYFHLEDSAVGNPDGGTPQNVWATSDLTTLLVSLDPSTPSTAPAPYQLTSLEASVQAATPFYLASDAWGGALPFPFAAISRNTTAGCSFCAGGLGAVAFLPNGRAVFSDGSTVGGLIAVQGQGAGTTNSINAIVISTTSLVQSLVK